MNRLIESFNNAIEGCIYVLKTQRNMRIHFLLALAFILFGAYINLTFLEIIIVCIVVALVLLTEMINTSIELVINLMKDTYHPIARIAKDVSAGAVLISALNAAVVGYLIFSRHVPFHIEDALERIRQSSWNITLLILIAVLTLTIAGKIIFHKGKPLRGGMPSGHAAMAFAMWAIMSFATGDALIILLTLFMAVLVAKSRVSMGVHTVWEVIAGSALGFFTSTLIFQLLRI